jgi:hypothetical protein
MQQEYDTQDKYRMLQYYVHSKRPFPESIDALFSSSRSCHPLTLTSDLLQRPGHQTTVTWGSVGYQQRLRSSSPAEYRRQRTDARAGKQFPQTAAMFVHMMHDFKLPAQAASRTNDSTGRTVQGPKAATPPAAPSCTPEGHKGSEHTGKMPKALNHSRSCAGSWPTDTCDRCCCCCGHDI